jgi:hypothetical protein
VSGLDALRRYEVVSAGTAYGKYAEPIPALTPSHPAPAVPCRPAASDEIPATAARLAKAAAAAGWQVDVTYARGTPMLGGNLVESVVVRMRSKYKMAVGVWVIGKFTSGWHWSAAHSEFGAEGYKQIGYRALVKHVKGDEASPKPVKSPELDGQLSLAL